VKPCPHRGSISPAGCTIARTAHQVQTPGGEESNCLPSIRRETGAGPGTRSIASRFGGLRMLLMSRKGCPQTVSPKPHNRQTSIFWRPGGDCVRQHPISHVRGWSRPLALGLLGPASCPHRRCLLTGLCRARTIADYTTARTRVQREPRSPGSLHRPSHYGAASGWAGKRGSVCVNATISGLLRAPSSSRARWEHSDQTP
jgi:hypothetical protein